jgi:hypothetical protein
MENLPKDLHVYLGLSLKYLDVISVSRVCKTFYKNIYQSEIFWRNRIAKEFPNHKDVELNMCEKTKYEHLYTFYGINKSWDEVKVDEDILTTDEINFYSVEINRMPKFFRLDNLIELNLNHNCLSKLKKLYLPSLKILIIVSNNIKYISKKNYFPNLTEIDFHNNNIEEFPEITLLQLKLLNLSKNKLRTFPNIVAPLLEDINVSDNKISYLPPINFEHLEIFYLLGNDDLKDINIEHLLLLPNIKRIASPTGYRFSKTDKGIRILQL